jgi:hypothetical protein
MNGMKARGVAAAVLSDVLMYACPWRVVAKEKRFS